MGDSARYGFVSGDGLRLAYRCWGADRRDALPLVLLHGLTGSSADWTPVATRLAARRRCFALDARGHGASDWSPEAAYAGDAHFADVTCALDALGIERCVLAGYSMGGGVAILTAGALAERVARLVIVDAYPDPEMTPGSRRIAEFVASTCDASLPPVPARFDPAIARRIAAELEDGEARRLDLWSLWESVSCPALVVRGEQSDVLPAALARAMLDRQPRAALATVPGAAHAIPFTHPHVLVRLIERFLDAPAATERVDGGADRA